MKEPNYSPLPEHLREGMRRYVKQGILPGDFLQAVIRNDLVDAIMRADPTTFFALHSIAMFLNSEMPAFAWGSKERMEAWSAAAKERAG